MLTTLSTKGQIVLPAAIRKKARLHPGEKIEVEEKYGKIILTPVARRRNHGLVKLLRSCPGELVIPPRDKSDTGRPAPKF